MAYNTYDPYGHPDKNETVTIGRNTYGNPSLVTSFPPQEDLAHAKKACRAWNEDPHFKKWHIRFSVVRLHADGRFHKKDRYSLISWTLV
jgi:hypothetical protein